MKFSFHIQDENFVDPLAPSNVFLKVPDRAGAPVDVFAANLNICKHEGHWMGPGGFVWEKLKSANMKDIGWGQGVSYERNWKKHCPPWSTKNPNEISDRAPAHQTPQILRRLNWFLKRNHEPSLNLRNFGILQDFSGLGIEKICDVICLAMLKSTLKKYASVDLGQPRHTFEHCEAHHTEPFRFSRCPLQKIQKG